MKKYISKLHFITQDLPNRTHLEQVQLACESGANWIQYRCMSKSDEEMLQELHPIASVCDDWGATLIITNHVHLVGLADIQGVHIEDMDADVSIIRNEIGESKTLGASAKDINQIKKHISNDADYIGLGPFAHTDTKPNNYSHLGSFGYEQINKELNKSGLNIPLIAVGGINLKTVTDLLATGIYGIAVSSAINKSENPKQMYKQFHQLIF